MAVEREKRGNQSYKERFQFVLSVNDNIICQRYFKINGFNEESLKSTDLCDTLNDVVTLIQDDLKAKSLTYLYYNTPSTKILMTGSVKDGNANYMSLNNVNNEANDRDPLLNPYDVTFKFSFIVDDRPVYERIWDGTVYPKFVRNWVDITNSDAPYAGKDPEYLNYSLSLTRKMTMGRPNLVYEIINSICDVCSDSFTKEYDYNFRIDCGNGKHYQTDSKK